MNTKIFRYCAGITLLVLAAAMMVGSIVAYSLVSENYRDYLWISALPVVFCAILAFMCIGNWCPCKSNSGTRNSENSTDSQDDQPNRYLVSPQYPGVQLNPSGRPISYYPEYQDNPVVHIINFNNEENTESFDSSGRFPFYATNYQHHPTRTSGSTDRKRSKKDDISPSSKSATSSETVRHGSRRSSSGGRQEDTSLLKRDSPKGDDNDATAPDYGSTGKTGAKRKYPIPIYGIMPKLPTPSPSPPKPELKATPRSEEKRRYLSDLDTSEELEKNNTWPRDYVKNVRKIRRYFRDQYDPYTAQLRAEEEAKKSILSKDKPEEKVRKWLLQNPIIPAETQDRESERRSESHRRRKTYPGSSRQSRRKKVRKSRGVASGESSPKKDDKPNKFFIMGKGYFYAVETDHYVPVEATDTSDRASELHSSAASSTALGAEGDTETSEKTH